MATFTTLLEFVENKMMANEVRAMQREEEAVRIAKEQREEEEKCFIAAFEEMFGAQFRKDLQVEYWRKSGIKYVGALTWENEEYEFHLFDEPPIYSIYIPRLKPELKDLHIDATHGQFLNRADGSSVNPRQALVDWLAEATPHLRKWKRENQVTVGDLMPDEEAPAADWAWGDKGPVTLYQCEYAIGTDSDGLMITNVIWTDSFVLGAKDYFCKCYSEKHGEEVHLWLGDLRFPEWLEQRYSSVAELPYSLRPAGEVVDWLKAIIDRQAASDTGDDGVDWEAVLDAQDPQP